MIMPIIGICSISMTTTYEKYTEKLERIQKAATKMAQRWSKRSALRRKTNETKPLDIRTKKTKRGLDNIMGDYVRHGEVA